ncbi:unnamed protein product [Moneuplotes crassus]|uniref:Uncharacterized protein n=1 Tax=Euplotes crassus TaxID=5936 RepID=A0AAD1X682_EUPCR|nr:unnamed protein product [Moneuplotes crassus]
MIKNKRKIKNSWSQPDIKIQREANIGDKQLSNLSSIRSEGSDINRNNESKDDYAQFISHLTLKDGSTLNIESSSGLFPKTTNIKDMSQGNKIRWLAQNQSRVTEAGKSTFLPAIISKVIPRKKEPKTRLRKYNFVFPKKQEAESKVKAYNLPETKYDVDTIKDIRIQYKIVYNEIECLKENAKMLNVYSEPWILFHFPRMTLSSKRSFNYKLEKLCGMIILISQIILQEFAKDPESIGISDVSHFLQQIDEINNEVKALKQNFAALTSIIVFLEDSIEAYSIISKSSDRVSARPQEVLKLLNLVSRARFNCTELIERIKLFEKNTHVKNHQKDQETKRKKIKKSKKDKENEQDEKEGEGSKEGNSPTFPQLSPRISTVESRNLKNSMSTELEKKQQDTIIFQSQVYYNPYMQEQAEKAEKAAKAKALLDSKKNSSMKALKAKSYLKDGKEIKNKGKQTKKFMAQVLKKMQPSKRDKFTINKNLFKTDKITMETDIDERKNDQIKVIQRHKIVTDKAMDIALSYCSSSVRDQMRSIRRGASQNHAQL